MINRKIAIALISIFAISIAYGEQSEHWFRNPLPNSICETSALSEGSITSEMQRYNIDYDAVRKLFGVEFREQYALNPMDAVCLSQTVIGNRYYCLTTTGNIYFYDGDTNEYVFLTTVPVPHSGMSYQGKGYSNLDENSKQERDNAVFQLIGSVDSKVLYGYCPTSGRIGVIDSEGVHWENIHLDNSIQMVGNESWPTPLMSPYIECDTLFAYYEPAWWSEDENDECRSELWAFNLQNGEFTTKALPETYGLSSYKPNQMLLLRRAPSGLLYLSVFDPYEAKILQDNLIELPLHITATNFASVASCISGLAFHDVSDSLVYAGAEGVFQSINGSEFRQIELNQPLWEELPFWGSAWIMQSGAYVFPNSDHYFVFAANIPESPLG